MADERRSMREIWERCKLDLRLMLAADVWELNVRPLRAVDWSDGTLTLATNSAAGREWCEVRLDRVIRREVCLEAGRDVRTVYILKEEMIGDN